MKNIFLFQIMIDRARSDTLQIHLLHMLDLYTMRYKSLKKRGPRGSIIEGTLQGTRARAPGDSPEFCFSLTSLLTVS